MSVVVCTRMVFLERVAFWLSSCVAGVVYFLSMASTVMLGRSGLWVASACEGAVFQPQGVPLWIGLNAVVARLLGWVPVAGGRNPAWGMNLFSVVCGALAVGLLARLLVRLMGVGCGVYLDRLKGWLLPSVLAFCGVSLALLFGFSSPMVEVSVVAGPEALGVLLFVGCLWLLLRLFLGGCGRDWVAFGLVFGFASIYGAMVYWVVVPFLLFLWRGRGRFLGSVYGVVLPILLVCHLLRIGGIVSSYAVGVLQPEVVVLRPMARWLSNGVPLGFVGWGYYVLVGVLLCFGVGSLFVWPRLRDASRLRVRMTQHWWLGVAFCGALIVVALLCATWSLEYVLAQGYSGRVFSFLQVWFWHGLGLGGLWLLCGRYHRSRRYALGVTFVDGVLLLMYQKGLMVGVCHSGVWWFWWPLVWVGVIFVMGWRWLLCGRRVVLMVGAFLVAHVLQYFVPSSVGASQVEVSGSLWVYGGVGLAVLGALGCWGVVGMCVEGWRGAARWAGIVSMACVVGGAVGIQLWHGVEGGRLGSVGSRDLGWLVGRSLLAGARGLEGCLYEDEEPLPDPFWPPPMGKDAVVLSGTLTGSSLTLYWAQVAGLRPDVSVVPSSTLTQVSILEEMRRYYGAEVWLPKREDLLAAHHRVMVDGPVGDVGVLPLMERYLVERVVEENVNRPFYLEGLSGRPGVDGVLEPMGMMFSVARGRSSQVQAVGVRDIDFWDWLTRLVMGRLGHGGDVGALRYFAQVRRAMAVAYQQQGWSAYAVAAFKDAMALYPVYTSMSYACDFMAAMALSQGVKGSVRLYENALRVCRLSLEREPKNGAILASMARIEKQKSALECCKSLQVSLDKGTISPEKRCQYIEACVDLQASFVAEEVAKVFRTEKLTWQQGLLAVRACTRAKTAEALFWVLQCVPIEQYGALSREELFYSADVAIRYLHRTFALALLKEAQRRYGEEPLVELMFAYYYHAFDDVTLAHKHLMRARTLSAEQPLRYDAFADERCRQIEARYLQYEEKGRCP